MYFNNYVKIVRVNFIEKEICRIFEKCKMKKRNKLHFSSGRFIRSIMLMTYSRIERLLLCSGFLDFY